MLCSLAKSMDPGAEVTLLVAGDAPLLVLGLEPAEVLRDFADPTALLVGPDDSSEVCAKKPVCGEFQYSGGGCAKKHDDAIGK